VPRFLTQVFLHGIIGFLVETIHLPLYRHDGLSDYWLFRYDGLYGLDGLDGLYGLYGLDGLYGERVTVFPPRIFVYCIAPNGRITVRVSTVVVFADTDIWAFCRSVTVFLGNLDGPCLARFSTSCLVLGTTVVLSLAGELLAHLSFAHHRLYGLDGLHRLYRLHRLHRLYGHHRLCHYRCGLHPFRAGWVTPFGREICVSTVACVRVNAIPAAVACGDRVKAASLAGRDTLLHEGAAEGTIGALISVLALSTLADTVLGGAGGVDDWHDGLCRHDGFGGVDSLRWWRR